jgi:peptidoglycan/LPS O-acetylase OafA/YrhL
MMILSVLFSYITYRLVEVPSIAYGNRKASLLYSSP